MLDGTAAGRVGGAVVVGCLIALVGLPFGALLATLSGDTGAVRAMLTDPDLATTVAHSVLVGVAVVVLAVPVGALLALLRASADVRGGRLLTAGVLLPLLVPQFVLGFSWSQAYGPAGLSDQLLGAALPGLFGPVGVVVVLAVDAVPLAYLVTRAGLAARAEPDLVRAARAAGADSRTALRTVTLPLVTRPLAAAAALVFVAALDSFAVPAVLGTPAGFATITTRIYQDLAFVSDPAAFPQAVGLGVVLVLLVVLALLPADRLAGRGRYVRTALPAGAAPQQQAWTRPGLALTAVAWVYLALTVGVPLLALLLATLSPAPGVPPTPAHWTLANLRQALADPAVPALGRSVLLAAIAGALLVPLGGLTAAVERSRRLGSWIGSTVVVTFALPGSVLAVGILLSYGRALPGSLGLILVAYLAKLWALGHRPITGALDALPVDERRAARASGAGAVAALRTVVLPPLTPALVAGWLLVFVTGLHELTMSALLYGPGSPTLAVVVLDAQQLGDVGTTAALSVLLTALVAVIVAPVLLVARLHRVRRPDARSASVTPAYAG